MARHRCVEYLIADPNPGAPYTRLSALRKYVITKIFRHPARYARCSSVKSTIRATNRFITSAFSLPFAITSSCETTGITGISTRLPASCGVIGVSVHESRGLRSTYLSCNFSFHTSVLLWYNHKIRHQAQHQHVHSFFACSQDLGYCAHSHHVRTHRPEKSSLRWRFVGWAANPGVRPLRECIVAQRQFVGCKKCVSP